MKIDVSIKKRQFHKNEVILESFKRAKDGNGRLHLLGLVSTAPGPIVLTRAYLLAVPLQNTFGIATELTTHICPWFWPDTGWEQGKSSSPGS